jgi:hypothetical protein
VRAGTDPLTVTREQIAALADLLDQNELSGSENQFDRCEQLLRPPQPVRPAAPEHASQKRGRKPTEQYRGYPHNVTRRFEHGGPIDLTRSRQFGCNLAPELLPSSRVHTPTSLEDPMIPRGCSC